VTVAATVREWLDAHVNLERGVGLPAGRRVTAPTLNRIRALLGWLGNPERDLRAIHLTGTNGKTSTARMCVALLDALGLGVGSYTSPHLERVNERIARNGVPIDDAALDELLEIVRRAEPQVDDALSYFEILTGAGLRWFADEAVDAAVIEVGLGGTWDATNVVDAEVAVVTNISLDHVEYLGPTRADIAAEKAGIVKRGSRLVLGETDPQLAPLFLAREPVSVLLRDRDFGVRGNRLAVGGRLVDLFTPGGTFDEVFLPLHGVHQADNAAAALAAVEAFVGAPLHPDVVAAGLGAVQVPGRFEIVGRRPLIVLDGAHNVDGAQRLVRTLEEEFPERGRTYVVGLLRQKEPHEMLTALGADTAGHLVVCRAPSPRAWDPETVAGAARDLGVPDDRIEVCDAVADAIGAALLATPPEGQIVVTGTLYVVGAARTLLVRP
jgi:dihydrofolate synthase/folylpolyglutamate synthase